MKDGSEHQNHGIPEMLFRIHRGLPREGPGDRKSTLRALDAVKELPPEPVILDAGCGPGAQTLDLLSSVSAWMIPLDIHRPYLMELRSRTERSGLSAEIMPVQGDMKHLPFKKDCFDLIWAEGSVYIMGFSEGLRQWKPYLKNGGFLAVSEISWLHTGAPEKVRRFWERNYPEMKDVPGNLELIREAGYECIRHFTLPDSSWWKEYYLPLQDRLNRLLKEDPDDEMKKWIHWEQEEIDLFRSWSELYGYVFYVMKKGD